MGELDRIIMLVKEYEELGKRGLVGVGFRRVQLEIPTFKALFKGQPYKVVTRDCKDYPYMLTIDYEGVTFVALI